MVVSFIHGGFIYSWWFHLFMMVLFINDDFIY